MTDPKEWGYKVQIRNLPIRSALTQKFPFNMQDIIVAVTKQHDEKVIVEYLGIAKPLNKIPIGVPATK